MRTIRTTIVTAVAALLALALPATALAQGGAVTVGDSSFNPSTVTIVPGDTVTWEVSSSLPHTITAEDGSFDQSVGDGDTFEHTYAEPGTYPYYCRIHGGPGGVGMAGTVVVEAAQDEEPTEAPSPTETATEEMTEAPSPTETATEEAPVTTGSITVSDQEGDGTSVVVESVTIDGADGFVVVHADEDGAPGPVLGHAAVDEGTTTALAVPMDTALVEDQTVWPMLHVDAGTPGEYEFPGADGPVTVDGQVVMDALAYTVVAGAPEQPEDELATTGRPGTIVLFLAGLLALGLGAAALRTPKTATTRPRS